ncbi:MAG: hypothetical protein RIB60_00730 [Phycisphaerales bacterium]
MPARARTKSQALAELSDRLAALDAANLPGVIERAEALVPEIDADRLYDESALVERLAGTPIELDNPGMVVGRAILTDLSSIVERLSELAGQAPEDLGAGALTPDELSERWSISTKTIARYRRDGLVARRVRVGGRTAVVFSAAVIASFEQTHADKLERAARFSRQSDREQAQLERDARRYRARFGWSLNRVARRLAERHGRSIEGMRQALQRIDKDADEPIFGAVGPPSERERAFFARAARRGFDPGEIAQHAGRSVASVRRGATEHRADFLRSLDLSGPTLATFERDEAREVLLGSAGVRTGLGAAGVGGLGAFLADARTRRVPDRSVERARLIAHHFLRHDASRRIGALSNTTAEPAQVDRAETDLRWASALKAELIRPHLTLIVETLGAAAGGAIERVPARELAALLRRSIGAASLAIDRFDLAREGRVAAPIGLAVSRIAAAWAHGRTNAPDSSTRASRSLPSGEPFGDWTLGLDAWQPELAVDPRVPASLPELDDRSRRVLELRFGIGGDETIPRTLGETADAMGTSVVHAARFERFAVRAALALARGG